MLLQSVIAGGIAFAGIQRYKTHTKKHAALAIHPTSRIKRNQDRTIFEIATSGNARLRRPRLVETLIASEGRCLPVDQSILTHAKRFTIELFGDTRQQYQRGAATTNSDEQPESIEATRALELSDIEKRVQRDFTVASGALALSIAGALVYAPFAVLSTLPLVYVARHIFQDAYQSLFKERRIKASVADSVMIIGCLVTGHYFAACLGGWIYFIARKLIIKTEDHSRKSLINVFLEQPQFVWILVDDSEVQIPFSDLAVGDVALFHAGQTVAVDGTIVKGHATIDQRILTGESQPAEKGTGDQVFASTVVLSGHIGITVDNEGTKTVAAQIGEILNNTTDFKLTTQLRGERIADGLALPMLLLSALSLPIIGPGGALVVLNANAVYQVRILTPIGVLNFLNLAARSHILIKDGRVLELLNRVDTVVFDKTGTLTLNQPTLAEIYTVGEISADELLRYAAAAERKQSHPIAQAILAAATERNLHLPDIAEASYEVGYGLKVTIDERLIRVGSARFMEMEGITIPATIRAQQQLGHEEGYSLVFVAIDTKLAGAIELRPTVRPEAKRIVNALRKLGNSMAIISGDHEQPTRKLADKLGIEEYFAETLPENKAAIVKRLQEEGRFVCFIGDGINDSIALRQANVSISLRGASSAATDTAQIILMDESLNQLLQVFDTAHAFEKNIKTMLAVTFGPSALIIGGAFFLHLSLVAAITLINAGLLVGIGNSMLPLIQNRSTSG